MGKEGAPIVRFPTQIVRKDKVTGEEIIVKPEVSRDPETAHLERKFANLLSEHVINGSTDQQTLFSTLDQLMDPKPKL